MSKSRIEYLESKLPVDETKLEEKYLKKFERYARYMGNGIYSWDGILSTDTRELWLMGILNREKINFKQE